MWVEREGERRDTQRENQTLIEKKGIGEKYFFVIYLRE